MTPIIETETIRAKKLSDNIILVEAKPEVAVNKDNASHANKLIQEAMGCNYGMIIDRKSDYSLDPVPVYQILNSIDTLKVIAIVLQQNASTSLLDMEKKLFNSPLEAFWNLDIAQAWVSEQLENLNKSQNQPTA